ncbi:hypothetical protein [Weissella fangxianensis]|uniref:hypothetical protein n=1 Tax=Weissella fangxianensis TaxID=2953879 RepID=UPI002156FEEC|nr:hypothetical protein [Weissella fangxianensis]
MAIRLVSSILITFIMILGVKYNQLIPGVRNIIETMGSDIYFIIFPLLLLSFYFLISQSILFYILVKSKRQSYFKKINMLFIADMKAKSFSFIHSIYLLSILLFAIFLGTSVLYSSYKGVKSWVESVYPFSFQYVALEKNAESQTKNDISYTIETFRKAHEPYTLYEFPLKSDWHQHVGFMSLSSYNSIKNHKKISLSSNEVYAISGTKYNESNIDQIKKYKSNVIVKGKSNKNILPSDLMDVYYVLPDDGYASLNFFENKVYSFDLKNWTTKQEVIDQVLKGIRTVPEKHLVTSRVKLFESENFFSKTVLFVGFCLV